MGRLRHRTAPGCTYFVTTKTWQNRAVLQVSESAEIVIECMLRYRDAGAYLLHEFVIMPNHLLLILTPSMENSLEKAMMLIKGGSSHSIHQQRESKMQMWAPGFHESTIRDWTDYSAKAKYIRENPVAAHLTDQPSKWPFGSASGRFQIDDPPKRLRQLSSGAEAPFETNSPMSELKLRPPRNLS